MLTPARILLLAAALLGGAQASAGEPWVAPGNLQVRHDLELLVDSGLLNIPLSQWPVPASDISAALEAIDDARPERQLTQAQSAAVRRLSQLVSPESTGAFYELAAAARPEELRTFWDEPRAVYQASIGAAGFVGDRFGGRLELTVADSPPDGDNYRPDGSYVAAIFGNWIVTLGAQDRWWGSGWQNSLILSNNARPVPAISIDRALSTPFESKWLSWIGPWRVSTFLGYMNEQRGDYDHPLLFGFRVTTRPFPQWIDGLEFSIERTAQFCGEGRSCTWKDFWNLWWGNDNAGENVNAKDEPGNQLASTDLRWVSPIGNWPYALFFQRAGETIDNKIPRPYRSLYLYGLELWGELESGTSWRTNLEVADTLCSGSYKGVTLWDCAYNNGIFDAEGYRYKGRVMGASMDGDGLQYAARLLLVPDSGTTWNFMVRYTQLNRGGTVDNVQNFVVPGPENWWSFDVSYRREIGNGWVEVSAGADDKERLWNDTSAFVPRGTLTWHQGF